MSCADKNLLNSLNVIFKSFARFRTELAAKYNVAPSETKDPARI